MQSKLDLANATGKIELAEDSIILNEEFKKNVAIPYFKDIYRDLVTQSDNKAKGVNRITILQVTIFFSCSTPSCLVSSASACSTLWTSSRRATLTSRSSYMVSLRSTTAIWTPS